MIRFDDYLVHIRMVCLMPPELIIILSQWQLGNDPLVTGALVMTTVTC